MSEQRTKSLVLIPDYLSVKNLHGQPSDAFIVGDPVKVPGELQSTDRFLNVMDVETQRNLMQLVPEIARASVITPSLAFYRRVFELQDSCYFADLTQRLLASGAHLSVISGMQRERVPKGAQGWLTALAADGVHIVYQQATTETTGARDLVTAADVAACYRQGIKELLASPRAIVTPYARDEAKERGITILTASGGQR